MEVKLQLQEDPVHEQAHDIYIPRTIGLRLLTRTASSIWLGMNAVYFTCVHLGTRTAPMVESGHIRRPNGPSIQQDTPHRFTSETTPRIQHLFRRAYHPAQIGYFEFLRSSDTVLGKRVMMKDYEHQVPRQSVPDQLAANMRV